MTTVRGGVRRSNASFGRVGVLAGIAALLFGGCSGTSEHESSAAKIFIRHVLQADPNQCFPTPESTWPALPFGKMDQVFTDSYEALVLFGNQHATAKNEDANRVTLNTAHVELREASGTVLQTFSRSATGFADPGVKAPGWGVTAVTLVPAGTLKPGAAVTLVASVKLEGMTLAGEVVETPSFEFTVKVCEGCLIQYPLDADDPSLPGYQCIPYGDLAETPCVLGQDDPIDCRLCAVTNSRCVSPSA